jgi:hypothetical protein
MGRFGQMAFVLICFDGLMWIIHHRIIHDPTISNHYVQTDPDLDEAQ